LNPLVRKRGSTGEDGRDGINKSRIIQIECGGVQPAKRYGFNVIRINFTMVGVKKRGSVMEVEIQWRSREMGGEKSKKTHPDRSVKTVVHVGWVHEKRRSDDDVMASFHYLSGRKGIKNSTKRKEGGQIEGG